MVIFISEKSRWILPFELKKDLNKLTFINQTQVLVLAPCNICYFYFSSIYAGNSGFISTEMIQAHFPKPSDTTAILLCGPPPMINHACLPKLDSLGYSSKNCFIF